jgi:uncharacterized protein (DUF427 family)
LVPDTREVVVLHGKIEVARTRRAYRVLETSHPPTFYLPRADVDITCLAAPSVTSACEWKGLCTSFDVAVAGGRLERAAWSYEQPFPEAKAIAGHVAFYADRLACFVAGERCRPQPGGYYGGWITSELVGPFKGEPNTRGA